MEDEAGQRTRNFVGMARKPSMELESLMLVLMGVGALAILEQGDEFWTVLKSLK